MNIENSTALLNDIWEWKETHIDTEMTYAEIIVEYTEFHEYDIEDIGEVLATNKNFKKIMENELKKLHVLPSDDTDFSEWM